MVINRIINRVSTAVQKTESTAPLAVFRMVFGLMMLGSIIRFWSKGWIHELYIAPKYFFSYTNFEWVQPLGDPGMYFLFALCGIFALAIALGLFYRFATIGFFLTFTYIELLDKTNYLNHYYFISVAALLLIFVPANRRFSLDVKLGRVQQALTTPAFYRMLLMLQLGMVYFFAGLAKLNSDWLIHAQPLKIWLKAYGHWPIVGGIFDSNWLPYVFSWSGAIYDLTIPFLLLMNRTRPFAYLVVIGFHVMTAILFPIGMFPFIMIGTTLIFFPPKFHDGILSILGERIVEITSSVRLPSKFIRAGLGVFLIFQILFPFRHFLYPGELFWHEQGFRFSWRVMLIEKAGNAFYYVQNDEMPRPLFVNNREFLTPMQEKMMATQPDMLVEYAHFLKKHYENEGIENLRITADVYVTLNGRQSTRFIDNTVDLSKVEDTWKPKRWVLPFDDEIVGL